jgi:predicted Rossmann-fold nucleotide-binding protein
MFNVDGFFDRLYEILQGLVKDGFMRETCLSLLSFATTPEEVLEQLQAAGTAVDVTDTKYV